MKMAHHIFGSVLIVSTWSLLAAGTMGTETVESNNPDGDSTMHSVMHGVVEWSETTKPIIVNGSIRTLCVLALDKQPDGKYEERYTDALKLVSASHQENVDQKVLYVLIPSTETEVIKTYFGDIDYRPAVFMVNRTTGAYARPTQAFTEEEKDDFTTTLKEFVGGFFENAAKGLSEHVVELSDADFDATMSTYALSLVEFYAPWCGHCKALAPEYETAAKELLKLIPPIPLVKVDATANPELKARFNVQSFPTLHVFKKGIQQQEYLGARLSTDIVRFMKNEARSADPVQSEPELTALRARHSTAVVGIIREGDTATRKMFQDLVSGSEYGFGLATPTPSLLEAVGVQESELPMIVVYKAKETDAADRQVKVPPESWRNDDYPQKAMRAAVEAAAWPLVALFSRNPEQRKKVMSHPVKDIMLLALDRHDFSYEAHMESLTAAARVNKQRLLHMWIDAENDRNLMQKLRISPAQTPAVIIFNPTSGGTKAGVRMDASDEEDISEQSLVKLASKYFDKNPVSRVKEEL